MISLFLLFMLKQQFIDKLVSPITYETENITTIAQVTRADDKNNCCDIQFVDRHGNIRNRDNVTVRLTGNGMDWFPLKNDYVIIELGRDTCNIIARNVSNYNMDIRSKMELKQDILSDSMGAAPGASIF